MREIKNILIIIFISVNAFSQNKQTSRYTIEVNYNMSYRPDSNNINTKVEPMELLINKKGSLFRSKKKGLLDSSLYIATNDNEIGKANRMYSSGIKYQILKDDEQIRTFDEFTLSPDSKFYYDEPKNQFKWDIRSDTMKIGNMNCQKAEVNFHGRKWIAWFTNEIAVSDGPYKFSGLPGLILSLQDSQSYWKFDFVSLKNIEKDITINFDTKWIAKKTDKAIFFKQKRHYIDNRMQIEEASGRLVFPDAKSKDASTKFYNEAAKKDNNWIEPFKNK